MDQIPPILDLIEWTDDILAVFGCYIYMVMKFGHDLLVNPWHQAWIASNHIAIRLLLLIERRVRLPDDLWFVRLTITTLCAERSIGYDVTIDDDYIGEDLSSATTTPLIDVNDYVDYVNNKKTGSK